VFLVVTLLCFGLAIYNLEQIVEDYLKYPATSRTSSEFIKPIVFPAITVCSVGWMEQSSMTDEEARTLIKRNATTQELENFKKGSPIKDLMRSCYFGKQRDENGYCDHLDNDFSGLFWSYHPSLGGCYTFNSHLDAFGNPRNLIKSTSVGKEESGLQLILKLPERFTTDFKYAGARIFVHPTKQPVLSESGSIMVDAGHWTTIGVTEKRVIREVPPYGRCVDMEDGTMNEQMSFYADRYDYSEDACITTCEQLMYIKKSGCCCHRFSCNPLNRSSILGYSIPSNISLEKCPEYFYCEGDPFESDEESDKFSKSECERKCRPACKETKYDLSWSKLALMSKGENTDHVFGVDAKLNAKVDINMASFVVHTEVASAKYDWSVLISNIGGVMGLFTGFSILTGFELVELMFDLVAYLVSTCCCRAAKK